jgi:hypothetical protein
MNAVRQESNYAQPDLAQQRDWQASARPRWT